MTTAPPHENSVSASLTRIEKLLKSSKMTGVARRLEHQGAEQRFAFEQIVSEHRRMKSEFDELLSRAQRIIA